MQISPPGSPDPWLYVRSPDDVVLFLISYWLAQRSCVQTDTNSQNWEELLPPHGSWTASVPLKLLSTSRHSPEPTLTICCAVAPGLRTGQDAQHNYSGRREEHEGTYYLYSFGAWQEPHSSLPSNIPSNG
jgi:hypothetical protein